MKPILCFIMLLLLLTSVKPAFSDAGITIIANRGTPVDSLNISDVKDIFLGKIVRWPDNSKIRFATLKGDIHNTFLKQFVGRSTSQYRIYWKKMLFTGKGVWPKSFDSEHDMIEFVRRTNGAVGYISENTVADDYKVIDVR